MTSHFLLISNTDTEISYTEDWKAVDSKQFDNLGNFGSPLGSTLHGLTGTSGTFSYFFHGSAIDVFGTVFVNDSSSRGSSWGCFVDGVSLGPAVYPKVSENSWSLCQQALSDGPHELQLVVNSTTDPFYFDYLLYVPSIGIPLENDTIYLGNTDPSVTYDSTWSVVQNENLTSTPGGKLTISFVGDSLDYYGFIPSELPHDSSSAQYFIDGQSVTEFTLPGFNASGSDHQQDLFNQKFFSTGPLTQGSHTLTVQNNGNSNVTPLTFSFALVSYATTPPPPNEPNPSSGQGQPSLPSSGLTGQHHTKHLPSIIGGAMAGVVFVAIIVTSAVICWMRRKSRIHLRSENAELRRANTISPLSVSQFSNPTPSQPMLIAPVAGVTQLNNTTVLPPTSTAGTTIVPTVAMSVAGTSQSRPQSHYVIGSSVSGSKSSITRAGSATKADPRQDIAVQNVIPQPAPEHISANEITPMMEDNEEIDDEEYDAPPPTYTSRPDVISAEKLKRYFMRHNK